jgi:hypothetical protein
MPRWPVEEDMDARRQILIVEPREDLRHDLEALLAPQHTVNMARSHEEGLAILRRSTYQTVLWGTGPALDQSSMDSTSSGLVLAHLVEALCLTGRGGGRLILVDELEESGPAGELNLPCEVWVARLPLDVPEILRVCRMPV